MESEKLKELLRSVQAGETDVEAAYEKLKELPYKELGFANIDNHRELRTGFAEAVYCPGKTSEQIRDIMRELFESGNNIMGTRATEENYRVVKEALPQAVFYRTARIILLSKDEKAIDERMTDIGDGNAAVDVAVVTAGTADIPVAEEAVVTGAILGCRVDRIYDVGVAGIHRLLNNIDRIRRARVVIVVAGMEGALASVVGGLVNAPVIAVPTSIGYGANLGGLSALLSMLNSCANGVAVVNIDNGYGAAYMSAVIKNS